jgi:N-acetylneuraminic acid mutarotase
MLFGGLNQSDVSVASIVEIRNDKASDAGSLPAPMHDMAATSIGAHAYTFGGGSQGSSDAILRDGVTNIGSLPAAASDATATTVGHTAYVVGGYDGANPLDTIVAWRPGTRARVVAHLPRPLRYAAVAVVEGRVLIAGGTSGVTARREILSFDPASGNVKTIGRLPSALTHAAGAALAGHFLVIGGRADSLTSQTAEIVAVDPKTGRTVTAGHLPRALSDAGAATLASRVLVVGGRDSAGVVHDTIYGIAAR